MKRITKIILSIILVLAAVVLPLVGNTTNYKADEVTQGNLTAANSVDYQFGSFNDIMVFACTDSTQNLLTLTAQNEDTFAWWYNFVLEYNAEKGTWVVTKADMTMADSANANCTEPLGEGKMYVMFHDNVTKTQKESYDFFLNTVEVGQEYYLSVDPSYIFDVYDWVEDAFLSTVPVDVKAPETESEEPSSAPETESEPVSEPESKPATPDNNNNNNQVNPLVIVAVVVVVIAVAGGVVVVIKRKK